MYPCVLSEYISILPASPNTAFLLVLNLKSPPSKTKVLLLCVKVTSLLSKLITAPDAKKKSPVVKVKLPEKVAAPAADMSNKSAVIDELPSIPLNLIS